MGRTRRVAWGFRRRSGSRRHHRRAAMVAGVAGLVACALPVPASGSTTSVSSAGSGPTSTACPTDLTGKATCYTGQDANGAYYAIAIPKTWNRSLVVHAHGGPDLGAGSDPDRSVDDLNRWSVMVDEGYAWAGSSYRRGGYGTRMAAADTENLRRLFVSEFGKPRRTYVHGQSWGGDVAAKVVETYGAAKHGPYDGALLTSGVLGGGSRGYDYRVDLRVVYQYYCRNHPRPSEPQYPLWEGLRADSAMTATGLRARLQECTGYASDPKERTAAQQRNLDDILAVTKIPERTLESHLRFATFTFRDIVHSRLGGRNPFSNQGVRYSGSHDDRALNAGCRALLRRPERRTRPLLRQRPHRQGDHSRPHHARDRRPHRVRRARGRLPGRSPRRAQGRALGADVHAGERTQRTEQLRVRQLALRTGRLGADREEADTACDRGLVLRVRPQVRQRLLLRHGVLPHSYASRVNPRPGGLRWPAMTAAQERTWSRIDGVGIAP